MRMALLMMTLACGLASAEDDLLKVGKTPAEKLDAAVKTAKDNVDMALEKIKNKNRTMTETLHSLSGSPAEATLPDPTAPDETFRQTFRTLLRGQSRGNDDLPPMPTVELAARVLRPGIEPAVLLKIDGRVVLVKDGEEISLVREGTTIQLRIQDIGDDSVRVLILPYNEMLTLQ